MKRPYTFTLNEDFKPVEAPSQPLSYPIRNAQEKDWKSPSNQISEQVFDGRFAYLYYYEYWISEAMDIPIDISMHDLHLIYPLLSDQSIYCKRIDVDFTFELTPGRGAYFYLAKGMYNLHLPVGHHILVGIILDAGMFRPPAIRHFDFISHLVRAKKEHACHTEKSVDFRVGITTLKYLRILFSRLNPNTLNNEYILLKHLIFLVELSRFKLLHGAAEDLVNQARQLLEIMIVQQGAQTHLQEIALILHTALEYLSREHQKKYHQTLYSYRHELLLNLIEQVIVENDKLIATAEQTGFSGPNEMNRFIRQHTGLTASQFKQQAEQKLNP